MPYPFRHFPAPIGRRAFLSRSDAASAAHRELGEGKFFRTTQNEDGDWKWHYEPGPNPVEYMLKHDFVAWVESDWDRDKPTPLKVGVLIVTCRLEEIDAPTRKQYRIEPITPELFGVHNPFAKPERRTSTGERASSNVESPTKLVWRLADEMTSAPRAEVIAACVSQGVHKSTASTQYYRWQKAKGS